MPKFSANLSMMFQEHAFLDRFIAAKDAGFDAVEFLFPYDFSPDELAKAVSENALDISVFNLFPGNWEAGERGLAALPGREADFRAAVERALPYADAMEAQRVHAMAGIAKPNEDAIATYLSNVSYAADTLGAAGLELLIEPINPRSMPGYFLSATDQAVALITNINHPSVRLQFDVFHHQITRGDVIYSLSEYKDIIGHIQIAGVPDRHEPDTGELNYDTVLRHIDQIDYSGWIGCEYVPRGKTQSGLTWLSNFLARD